MKGNKKKRLCGALLAMALPVMLSGCEPDEPEFRKGYWWDHPGESRAQAQEEGVDWWNALDESWTKDDWELTEDGLWRIYDGETNCTYLYDEETQEYGAMDMETEETYLLDRDTGEWLPAE